MNLIRQAQEIVLRHSKNPFYQSDYRDAETGYWQHIPGWIERDLEKFDLPDVLDIGCGYGTLSVFVRLLNANARITCINHTSEAGNISDELIRACDLKYDCRDIELLPLEWRGYDCIIMTEVLEHFNFYPVPTLKKIIDGLDFYGRIYISTPNAAEWGRLDKYASWKDMPKELDRNAAKDTQHKYQYTEEELRELLDMAGISIISFEGGRHFNITGRRK